MYQFERRERLSRAQSLVGAASFSSSTVQSYGLPFPWDTFDLGGGGAECIPVLKWQGKET